MGANDNLLAGLTGVLEGAQSILVPWIQMKQKANIADQMANRNMQREMQMYPEKLRMQEESTQRLSQVDISPEVGSQFGIPPGKHDKEILPLYINKMRQSQEMKMGLRQRDILQYSESMERNPIIKTIKSQELGFDAVENLIALAKSGNTTATSALGIKMAKALGEVGVMTEEDVVKYIESKKLTQKVADKYMQWMQGKISDMTLDEIQIVADAVKNSMKEKQQAVYGTYTNRLARVHGISPKEAAYLLDVPYYAADESLGKKASTDGSTVKPTDSGNANVSFKSPNDVKAAYKAGKLSREQAKEILRRF